MSFIQLSFLIIMIESRAFNILSRNKEVLLRAAVFEHSDLEQFVASTRALEEALAST